MIHWLPYPRAAGQYAYSGTLCLTAWDNGNWTVQDTKRKIPARHSDNVAVLAKLHGLNLETAKKAAEQAAMEMEANNLKSA